MKLSIEIDCTPEEARRFLGLPDVTELNETLVAELQAKMSENLQSMSPEEVMKTWLPAGMQSMEQMQKAFWSQFANPGGGQKP